jgi:hypothetical protein
LFKFSMKRCDSSAKNALSVAQLIFVASAIPHSESDHRSAGVLYALLQVSKNCELSHWRMAITVDARGRQRSTDHVTANRSDGLCKVAHASYHACASAGNDQSVAALTLAQFGKTLGLALHETSASWHTILRLLARCRGAGSLSMSNGRR